MTFKILISGSAVRLNYNIDHWSKINVFWYHAKIMQRADKSWKFRFQCKFSCQKSSEIDFYLSTYIKLEEQLFWLLNMCLEELYFPELGPISDGSVHNFGKKYEKNIKIALLT